MYLKKNNTVPRAPGWYTKSKPPYSETHILDCAITADLPLHEISNDNILPNDFAKAFATKKVQGNSVMNHVIL